MHVVVVGCGRVGSELAGTLEKSGHTVAVIDKNANAFRRLPAGHAGDPAVGQQGAALLPESVRPAGAGQRL